MQANARMLPRPDSRPEAARPYGPVRHVLDRFEPFASVLVVQRAQAIRSHGDPADSCWRIQSGCVRTLEWLGGGRRLIVSFQWPGDMLGIDDAGAHEPDAEAVTDVALRRYPRRMIEAAAECDATLALWLRALSANGLTGARDHIALLGRKTAIGKIAAFLLALDRRSAPADGWFVTLPMSRADIADHLGLSIETVCRNLVQLEREGTVAIRRLGIELRDHGALRRLASE